MMNFRSPLRKVVALGDSITMGWGVEQSEAFPQLLETELGVTTLNAGVSSFGTARSLELLRRIDLSNLKLLLIQYHHNDLNENLHVRRYGEVPASRLEKYRATVRQQSRSRRYYPGRFAGTTVVLVFQSLWELIGEGRARPVPPREEVRTFLHLLEGALDKKLPQVPIVVFEATSGGTTLENSTGFIQILASELKNYPAAHSVRVIDATAALTPRHYFTVDAHPNAFGHRAIADALLPVVSTYLQSREAETQFFQEGKEGLSPQ